MECGRGSCRHVTIIELGVPGTRGWRGLNIMFISATQQPLNIMDLTGNDSGLRRSVVLGEFNQVAQELVHVA